MDHILVNISSRKLHKIPFGKRRDVKTQTDGRLEEANRRVRNCFINAANYVYQRGSIFQVADAYFKTISDNEVKYFHTTGS